MSEKNSPSVVKIVLVTICTIFVLGLGACTLLLGGGVALLNQAAKQQEATRASEPSDAGDEPQSSLTLSKYKKLKTGMNYKRTVAVLGAEGVEDASNDLAGLKTTSYTWTDDGGTVNLIFQNGKLMQKTQFNLH